MGLLALLILPLLARTCRDDSEKVLVAEVSMRCLVCTNCNAQYEISEDYFEKVAGSDIERGAQGVAFRCRKCEEISALPGMIVVMNGEVVGIQGAHYDEERAIDEM
jgi:hypothetical protein